MPENFFEIVLLMFCLKIFLTTRYSRIFPACFVTEEPLQTGGPELKTKLHDRFEPYFASYHPLIMNRVLEVLFQKQRYLQKDNKS